MMSLYSWVTISKSSLDLDPDPCLLSSLWLEERGRWVGKLFDGRKVDPLGKLFWIAKEISL